jgi:hypothetical protein
MTFELRKLKNMKTSEMRKLLLLVLSFIVISCSTAKQSSSLLKEDEFFITRKYIGDFIDYRHTAPESFGSPHLIWIKTTMDSTYGKISAYSKKCEFSPGEKLYLKRTYSSPGMFGFWGYQIENDSSVYYRVSEFQYDNKVLVQTMF